MNTFVEKLRTLHKNDRIMLVVNGVNDGVPQKQVKCRFQELKEYPQTQEATVFVKETYSRGITHGYRIGGDTESTVLEAYDFIPGWEGDQRNE
jgi:hypothetical protein